MVHTPRHTLHQDAIQVTKAREHNLKAVSCTIPHNCFVCLTGVSGSGKSSFAFDTIYAEGQRRYLLSLSHQAKRLLQLLPKPDVESITGLTPTVAIEQRSPGTNPRSTVGTMTEIHDYLRLLFARYATPHCPETGEQLFTQSKDSLLRQAFEENKGKKITILAPRGHEKKSSLKEELALIERKGYTRVRLDGTLSRIDEISQDSGTNLDILIDKITLQNDSHTRFLESMTLALEEGQGTIFVLVDDEEKIYSLHSYAKTSKKSYPPLEPQDFSFNSPSGMCTECQGLGQKQQFILSLVIDPTKSIAEDCCSIASPYNTVRFKNIYDNLASLYDFSVTTPWNQLSEKARHIFLYGTEKKWTRMVFIHPETGATWYDNVQWRGVLHEALTRYSQATSERFRRNMEKLMQLDVCPTCNGGRLKPYPLASRFLGKSIHELSTLSIEELLLFFKQTDQSTLIQHITSRLQFLSEVGLTYLTLDRAAPTLSGGELQRVRLASHLGSGLTGLTYILDEPSIGLHPIDNQKLLSALRSLQQKGNSVIVVEHDEETMRSSDYLIDFGPQAGAHGGQILHSGSFESLLACSNSLTAEYLKGSKSIIRKAKKRETATTFLTLRGACLHNLHGDTLSIPLERFVAITGVSGSGKSSLITDTLYPALSNKIMRSELVVGPYESLSGIESIERIIAIDQTPIGRTPRSNPATYTKLFDEIRTLFASLPDSKAKGWNEGRFSFNVKEGCCPECEGMGQLKIDMDFLEPAWVECPLCFGMRFDAETLTAKWKSKSIHDVLSMTFDQAAVLFEDQPFILKKIHLIQRVGLGYLTLGQPSNTLSGGEAQRIKIAKELSRPDIGKTLYLLDEPTTGLHFHDIQALIDVLHELVDRKNTVVIIEHNMDLVRTADWVIDIGPGSGTLGGQIIASGTPKQISQLQTATGSSLRPNKNKAPLLRQNATIPSDAISITGARQNNLKNLILQIPKNGLTSIIGPSGSGKSSFAFETLHAEGEGRFIESLAPYVRQFLKPKPRAHVDSITGLFSTIALERRHHMVNPRSTVGTLTEIYDYVRILWAQLGIAHCPTSGQPLSSVSKEKLVEIVLALSEDTKVEIHAPLGSMTHEDLSNKIKELQLHGYNRIDIDGKRYDLTEQMFESKRAHKKATVQVVIDRLKPKPENKSRIYASIQEACRLAHNHVVLVQNDIQVPYSLAFCSPSTHEVFPEITSQTFAFNSPEGMCPDCKGLGFLWGLDIAKLSLSKDTSAADLLTSLLGEDLSQNLPFLLARMEEAGIHPFMPIHTLPISEQQQLFKGAPLIKGSSYEWLGIDLAVENSLRQFESEETSFEHLELLRQALSEKTCPSCQGSRLHQLARHVTIEGLSISDFADVPITKALYWLHEHIASRTLTPALQNVYHDIEQRMQLLNSVGVGYLSLSRAAHTLSGGEAQRVKLISQIGAKLSHVTYILDEPAAGLHAKDAQKVYDILTSLKQKGNGVIAIEHNLKYIKQADWIVELGPEGGSQGGELLFQGTPEQWSLSDKSVTAPFLKKQFKFPQISIPDSAPIHIQNATVHNLKNISCTLPTGCLISIIGPSGSGKSTLLFDVIETAYRQRAFCSPSSQIHVDGLEQFTDIVTVDQATHGFTSRSDIGSYIDILSTLRSFYASLPQALQLGLEPRHFSPNQRKGMCTHCWGMGYKKMDMLFLAPTYIPCPECKGLRLNRLSLSVEYKGLSFGKALQLPLSEFITLFSHLTRVKKRIVPLLDLGLGYLTLGQEMNDLSNGEFQRLKIAKECWKQGNKNTLFLLDEPTSGLHIREVENVIRMLKSLQQKGHSIISIEHNEAFIAATDWILELGPGAGDEGGRIIYNGRPNERKRTSTK